MVASCKYFQCQMTVKECSRTGFEYIMDDPSLEFPIHKEWFRSGSLDTYNWEMRAGACSELWFRSYLINPHINNIQNIPIWPYFTIDFHLRQGRWFVKSIAYKNHGCGSVFIFYGSGSRAWCWMPIRILIQYGSRAKMTKNWKQIRLKFFFLFFFDPKLQFTYP